MKNQTKFVLGAVAAVIALSAFALATTYSVYLDEQYEFSIETCGFSGPTCLYSGGDVSLNVDSSWYTVDPALYSIDSGKIVFRDDAYCDSHTMKCCSGGGCGSGGG